MRIEDVRRQATIQPTRPAFPRLVRGRPSQDPGDRERVVQAVEKTYASLSYTDLAEARDRRRLAVRPVLEDIRHNENQLKNRNKKEN
ncbi:hypothetical protein ACWDGI_29235 [Streptomyces sp. NPDC001220]